MEIWERFFRIYLCEFFEPSLQNLVSEVEEDLSEDHEMPVVEAEVESMMFAAGRMRGDQDIMQTLGVVPLLWGLCGACLS